MSLNLLCQTQTKLHESLTSISPFNWRATMFLGISQKSASIQNQCPTTVESLIASFTPVYSYPCTRHRSLWGRTGERLTNTTFSYFSQGLSSGEPGHPCSQGVLGLQTGSSVEIDSRARFPFAMTQWSLSFVCLGILLLMQSEQKMRLAYHSFYAWKYHD